MHLSFQFFATFLALQLGVRGQPIMSAKSPTRLPDPFTVYLKVDAAMTAEEHAKWATSVQEDQKNERNLPGVGNIFPASDEHTEGYTGSFTPETVDIIRDHPDVLEVHDKAIDWLKATGQEGRIDHHRVKGES